MLISVIHIVLCVVLSAVVLMQHRKQGGFGGAFGGGTQADVGQWQRFTALTRITVILAAFFMLTSILLILIK
jgi:preprotein translocase subunit SecG